MRKLIQSEWERIWKRKTTWLLFVSIPFILLAAANYLLKQNKSFSPEVAQYTVTWNFPIMGLSEMLFTVFQGVILVIVVFLVTDEYQDRSIRLILMRSYSNLEVIFAKYIVALSTILLFFVTYFIASYAVGWFFFSNVDDLVLFYHQKLSTPFQAFLYNIRFYTIAYFTSVAIASAQFFIACISRTTTAAIGVGIGFLFLLFIYPNVLSYFESVIGKEIYMRLFFTSIPMIQWQGITYMLAENPFMALWNIGVVVSYIILFTFLSFLVMRKSDYFN
jgi:ABC-2 type transport system permease protein